MSAKFTSGPWKVDYQDKRGGNIIAPSGPVANTRWFGIAHNQVMEDYANADLIAAAPVLYEALVAAIVNEEEQWIGKPFDEPQWIDDARAALAKARGER